METWTLGLSAWIIQDGNYGEFSAGQAVDMAVEFYAEQELTVSDAALPRRAHPVEDAFYDVAASVVYDDERALVLDCGIRVYRERPRQRFPVESTVGGRVALGVDPFFYFESLARLPNIPPLIYTWTISGIRRQTAPFIRTGNMLVRDRSQLGWVEIERTDAWHDDGGHGEYLLECELHSTEAKLVRATAV